MSEIPWDRLEKMRENQRREQAVPVEQALGGQQVSHSGGVFHRRAQLLGGHLRRALCPGFGQRQAPHSLATRSQRTRVPYLDTETTGFGRRVGHLRFSYRTGLL